MSYIGAMRLPMTRVSVSAGDDFDVPHRHEISLPDGSTVEEVVSLFAEYRWRQSYVEHRVKSADSRISLAGFEKLNDASDMLRAHLNYHAQQDPDVVFDILSRLSGDGF